MGNCLSTSQLYDREYLFCMSMPNKTSVSSSLSHVVKVWEILKLAMQRYNVALPSEYTADPSPSLSVLLQVVFWSCTDLQSYCRC